MLLPFSTCKSRISGVGIPVPLFFLVSLILVLFYYFAMSTSDQSSSVMPVAGAVDESEGRDFYFQYTVLKGYFLQSEESTDDTKFDFRKQNFGLIDREYHGDGEGGGQGKGEEQQPWQRFEKQARRLAGAAKEKGESVKVLFLGRHGQGYHNVAETKYGTKAWDCYWSALNGADGITWADANLTAAGQQQARDVNTLWAEQLPLGIPPPETYYTSPLTRTIETADLSFRGLHLPNGREYKPLVKELLREALGVHTCDRRSTKSHIENTFPHVAFEAGFSGPDTLWEPDYREPRSARAYRLARLLDDVFATDDNVFLSLTSHSGAIGSILEVTGHRSFALETGGVIPVFVRAERVQGKRAVPPKEPSDAPPLCKEPPV
ncbi:phosphoglycerate mutase-like protein [Clathrospora elynae]|uniref:Phosphoglycerate mutase-like protein n=1 Tax=Clathrospora elynae TaxID=706981 RepID=A0A6A5SAM8_9PLEO|nr:phosphoglycerate mutase-like protein [Clathrospora elynae]